MEKLNVILAGFGKVAAGNVDDPVMGKIYRYASHIQAIQDHPRFQLAAVIDPSETARQLASRRWGAERVYAHMDQVPPGVQTDILVLTTPPAQRPDWIPYLNRFCAAIVEKPLGVDEEATRHFVASCNMANIPVQVHFWRRAVPAFRNMRQERLKTLLGKPSHIQILYGNGLRNNGVHLVDFTRFLFGEIVDPVVVGKADWPCESSIPGDANLYVHAKTMKGVPVYLQPVNFSHWRENGVILSGSGGQVSILNDGRTIRHIPVREHGGLSGATELAYDDASWPDCDFDLALYELYENLSNHLDMDAPLWSPLNDAALSEAFVDSVFAMMSSKPDGDAGH